jgi:hypothetical protein
VNVAQASRRGIPILPALCLFCTIRNLAGASYLDIRFLTGISVPSIYRIIWKTITALISCQVLPSFPHTADQHKLASIGFESISTGAFITNCGSVIDGYHLSIQTPPKNEAKNVQSFFSGQYHSY